MLTVWYIIFIKLLNKVVGVKNGNQNYQENNGDFKKKATKNCERTETSLQYCNLYNDGLLKPQTKGGEKVTTKARQILITNYMPRGSWHLTWNPMSGAENFANLRNILWREQRCIIPLVHLYNWIPQHYCEYHISISYLTLLIEVMKIILLS